MKWLRKKLAQRKLRKLVEARRNSFECVSYRKRRDAALLGRLRRPVA